MARSTITRSYGRLEALYFLFVIFLQCSAMWILPSEGAELTLIHMGDVHGHLTPRPTARGETMGKTEGGLARMYTKINEIRDTTHARKDVADQHRRYDPGLG